MFPFSETWSVMACGIPDRKSSVRPTFVDGNFEVQETDCNPGKFDQTGSLDDDVVGVSGVKNLNPGVVGRAKNVLLLIYSVSVRHVFIVKPPL